MDLKELQPKSEGVLELRHPATGEILRYGKEDSKVMHIVLAGRDSELYQKAQRKVADRRFKQQQKFRQAKFTSAMLEEETLEILTAVTLGGMLFVGGKEVAVTSENAADIYKEYPWIKEQVDMYLEDRGNFL